jgi:hypothetical protein
MDGPGWICVTCGVEQAADGAGARAGGGDGGGDGDPPVRCPICDDERQYVGWDGQRWTRLAALRAEGRRNRIEPEGPGDHEGKNRSSSTSSATLPSSSRRWTSGRPTQRHAVLRRGDGRPLRLADAERLPGEGSLPRERDRGVRRLPGDLRGAGPPRAGLGTGPGFDYPCQCGLLMAERQPSPALGRAQHQRGRHHLMPRSNRAAAGGKSRSAVRAKNRKLKADAPPEKRRGKADK